LLLGRELREVAYERDQVPARTFALLATVPPRGHAGEPDAVVDDVEDLTVRELLRLAQPQVRGAWIEVAAYLRLSATVVCVADRAMVREVCATGSHHLLRGGHWIAKLPERTRDAYPPQLACHGCLDGAVPSLAGHHRQRVGRACHLHLGDVPHAGLTHRHVARQQCAHFRLDGGLIDVEEVGDVMGHLVHRVMVLVAVHGPVAGQI